MAKRHVACLAVLLCLGLLGPAASGDSQVRETAKAQNPLQYEVAVTLKLIQVYVTDKSGKPVADLKKEDFIVFDNGRPVAVTDFERHLFTLPGAAPAPKLPTETVIATEAPQARLLSRKFFVFFDFAYNNTKGVLKAREAALHFIDTEVRPDDELALISYSMLKGLIVHEYLTRDHAKVRATIEAIGVKEVAGRAEDIEDQYWRQAGEAQTSDSHKMNLAAIREALHRNIEAINKTRHSSRPFQP